MLEKTRLIVNTLLMIYCHTEQSSMPQLQISHKYLHKMQQEHEKQLKHFIQEMNQQKEARCNKKTDQLLQALNTKDDEELKLLRQEQSVDQFLQALNQQPDGELQILWRTNSNIKDICSTRPSSALHTNQIDFHKTS